MRQPFLKVWPAMLRVTRKVKVLPGSILTLQPFVAPMGDGVLQPRDARTGIAAERIFVAPWSEQACTGLPSALRPETIRSTGFL